MWFAAYTDVPFITFFNVFCSVLYYYICGCKFSMFLINFVIYVPNCYVMYSYFYVYVFLLLCTVLVILFRCVVLCIVCGQMCTVLLPPRVNPIAVNKHNLSYTLPYHTMRWPLPLP